MLTPDDLKPLDYSLLGGPFSDISTTDVSGLDIGFYGEPQYLVFGTLAYNPNMAAEFSVSVTFTPDPELVTDINLSGDFTASISMSGFMDVGVSAKLVNIF